MSTERANEKKGLLFMATEPGAIVLPKWFTWMAAVIGVPTMIGAIPWAYSVQVTLTEISVTLKYMGEANGTLRDRIVHVEDHVEAHLTDPSIHKYELERIKASIQRIDDRLKRLETP